MALSLGVPLEDQSLTIRLNLRAKIRFPSSGELNFTVLNAVKCIERVQNFISKATSIGDLDGLWMSFDTWRFNLHKSNM